MREIRLGLALVFVIALPSALAASTGEIRGRITDMTGGALPGVMLEARREGVAGRAVALTDGEGRYVFTALDSGTYEVRASLFNFATFVARDVVVRTAQRTVIDASLTLALNADVTVTGQRSFRNLADIEDPAANLIGVAASASQGAVTSSQIGTRPIMRAGEVLETVPGVIISQHSGEGKANQYYLRGFNLDHGTDFAMTVAGMPVNLPTHGHGHGYSDANFLIPELVSGVQYSKGPYFAQLGDFSSAGSANINYVDRIGGDKFLARIGTGEHGWSRALVASSPRVAGGRLLYALELGQNDGPWVRPDRYKKVNGLLRYSRSMGPNSLSLTGMAYRASWNSTDQVPARAIESGALDRFGSFDSTDGGQTSRYGGVVDWQLATGTGITRMTGYGFHYDVNLFSNFTYALDDPENGDQFEQADSRFVAGGRVAHYWMNSWAERTVFHTVGVQARNDSIGGVGLYRTRQRQRLSTIREDEVRQTSGAVFYENKFHWSPKVRTEVGVRADIYRFRVNSDTPVNSGDQVAGIVSPKASVVLSPFTSTEVYVNAGMGFHSNDARGATITLDPSTGEPAERVTPLVRATGGEIGIRTVAFPRTQLTLTLWTLALDSELLFVGDAGTTEASRPSRRTGIEATAYFRPFDWLTLDGDVAFSRARFSDTDPAGARIPGSAGAVVSAGVSVSEYKRLSGSARVRYFGPRPLIEDDSVRSNATSLLNAQATYRLGRQTRVIVDAFNVFNRRASDIDYFYTSRLPGEPQGGIGDVHLHPTLPRSFRVSLEFGF
jgi:hypothetical protein